MFLFICLQQTTLYPKCPWQFPKEKTIKRCIWTDQHGTLVPMCPIKLRAKALLIMIVQLTNHIYLIYTKKEQIFSVKHSWNWTEKRGSSSIYFQHRRQNKWIGGACLAYKPKCQVSIRAKTLKQIMVQNLFTVPSYANWLHYQSPLNALQHCWKKTI